jgi:hypothetical protein
MPNAKPEFSVEEETSVYITRLLRAKCSLICKKQAQVDETISPNSDMPHLNLR